MQSLQTSDERAKDKNDQLFLNYFSFPWEK